MKIGHANHQDHSDKNTQGSLLAIWREDPNVTTVFALGPATRDCLKQTVVVACQLGFQIIVLKDAIGTGVTADNFKQQLSSQIRYTLFERE